MKWYDVQWLNKHGSPSRRIIDANDPSTYAPAELSHIGESKALAPEAAAFDPSAFEVDMGAMGTDMSNAVRLAAGLAMRRLNLPSVQVRWFRSSLATRGYAGLVKGADTEVIWLNASLSPEDAGATLLHEARHLAHNKGVSALSADGRHSDALTLDALAERDALDFETRWAPLFRHQLGIARKSGFPWEHPRHVELSVVR